MRKVLYFSTPSGTILVLSRLWKWDVGLDCHRSTYARPFTAARKPPHTIIDPFQTTQWDGVGVKHFFAWGLFAWGRILLMILLKNPLEKK